MGRSVLYEREDDAGKQDENADGGGGSLGVLVAHVCFDSCLDC
jgi:hypothetical protein